MDAKIRPTPRLTPLPVDTNPELKDIFDAARNRMGFVPNDQLIMQRKPKILKALAALSAAINDPDSTVPNNFKRLIGHVASRSAGAWHIPRRAHTDRVSTNRSSMPSGITRQAHCSRLPSVRHSTWQWRPALCQTRLLMTCLSTSRSTGPSSRSSRSSRSWPFPVSTIAGTKRWRLRWRMNRRISRKAISPSMDGRSVSTHVERCRLLALFCRANRAEQCPVSGVKQPCRRNRETAEVDPNETLDTWAPGESSRLLRSLLSRHRHGKNLDGTLNMKLYVTYGSPYARLARI